jgi:hypothetical protein
MNLGLGIVLVYWLVLVDLLVRLILRSELCGVVDILIFEVLESA